MLNHVSTTAQNLQTESCTWKKKRLWRNGDGILPKTTKNYHVLKLIPTAALFVLPTSSHFGEIILRYTNSMTTRRISKMTLNYALVTTTAQSFACKMEEYLYRTAFHYHRARKIDKSGLLLQTLYQPPLDKDLSCLFLWSPGSTFHDGTACSTVSLVPRVPCTRFSWLWFSHVSYVSW